MAGAYNNVTEQTKMSYCTNHSFLIQSAPWIEIPYPFQWSTPIFRASHVFGMIGAALTASIGKFGALFVSIPLSIFAVVYFLLSIYC
ncbi:hypothetical protein I3842_13G147700 [Carya illinoinensis]|uniref:Uncharacterized protein n=1 Tax=Carya illinoinensis TaxID=32201 RepID=A0A922AJJ0_CARIL|nr:hypothetical protein I3842_13G147700 [Carya illinoinensis]